MLVNYWIRQGTNVQGPFGAEAVRTYIAAGKARPGMLVSTDQINWRVLADVPELQPDAGPGAGPELIAARPIPAPAHAEPVRVPPAVRPHQRAQRPTAARRKGRATARRASPRTPPRTSQRGSGRAARGSSGSRTVLIAVGMVVVGAIVIALALRGGGDGGRGNEGPRSAEQIVDAAVRSVALIKDEVVSGTGFMVADGLMATNAHVVRRMLTSDMQVYFPSISKERYTVDWIVHLDDSKDLALLSIRSTQASLPLAKESTPKRGAELLLIGNPGVGEGIILENAVSRGLAGPPTQLKGQRFLQVSASINPGNSGGPAIDRRGRVVGMVTLKAANKEGLAFAIPSEDIAAAIRSQALLSDSARLQLNQKLIGGAIFLRLHMAGDAFLALSTLQVGGLRKALENGAQTIAEATPYLPNLTARTAKVRNGIGAKLERYIRMIEGSRWMDAQTKEDMLDFQQMVQTFDARASRPDVLSVLSYLAEFENLHTKYKRLEERLRRRFDVPKDE